MARYVDPDGDGAGDRARPRHRAGDRGADRARRRSRRGWCWSSSTRHSASCCASAFPRRRSCRATPTGCASRSATLTRHEAAAVVSGLPLMTKPLRMRLRLLREALGAAAAARAVRAVHLRGGAADPEARRRQGRGLRAHLAQHAARARVGLSARIELERCRTCGIAAHPASRPNPGARLAARSPRPPDRRARPARPCATPRRWSSGSATR